MRAADRDADAVVVGAGHNGLVAAFYLARAGLSVLAFERRASVGGAAYSEETWPGFTFMPCAHITSAPHPRIVRDMRLRERGVEWIDRSFYPRLFADGTHWAGTERPSARNRATDLTAAERAGLREYGEFAAALRRIFAPYRLGPPPALEAVRSRVAGTSAAAVLERALSTGLDDLRAAFLPTTRLRDTFAAESVHAGRNPSSLTLAWGSVGEPDEETGERPPNGQVRGGTGVLTARMRDAAEEAGARVHTGAEVEGFLTQDRRVVGVRLAGGRRVRSRVVLSNLDPKRTFLGLCAPEDLDAGFRHRVEGLYRIEAGAKFLAVLSELPEWTAWDREPAEIHRGAAQVNCDAAAVARLLAEVEAGEPPSLPCLSVSVPSVVDPSLAPSGYHTASVYIPLVPSRLARGDWDAARQQSTEAVIDAITAHAPNFRRSVVACKLRTPLDLERENGLTDGQIWHVLHTGGRLFWNRPLPELAHYRAPLPGLYLCGAGQHPGGEVTGLPGRNAAAEVLRDLAAGAG